MKEKQKAIILDARTMVFNSLVTSKQIATSIPKDFNGTLEIKGKLILNDSLKIPGNLQVDSISDILCERGEEVGYNLECEDFKCELGIDAPCCSITVNGDCECKGTINVEQFVLMGKFKGDTLKFIHNTNTTIKMNDIEIIPEESTFSIKYNK